ncbi:MAG: SDR family oxidoreductase [Planctomycetota bacterium]|nr:SDR family oxidoreductase [Planctomycetota bacterium]
MPDFSQKTSLVTGASSGIGQAIAIQLAKQGSALLLHYCSNKQGIENTIQQVENFGIDYCVLQSNFLEQEQVDEFCNVSWAWKSGIDVLVNNAGGDVLTTDKKEWTFEQKLEFLWQLDVKSCLTISRNLGQRMKSLNKKPLPVVINIGWDQSRTGQAGDNGELFATTKGAITSFTRSLAKSLAPQVRVNCVAPGWIQTSWGQSTSDYWDERAKKESLLNRWGTPSDVANAVCLLASDQSEFINGQTLEVNGGIRFGCE